MNYKIPIQLLLQVILYIRSCTTQDVHLRVTLDSLTVTVTMEKLKTTVLHIDEDQPSTELNIHPGQNIQLTPFYESGVDFPATLREAEVMSDKRIIGYEGLDGNPLQVIKDRLQGDLIPGKLTIKHKTLLEPWSEGKNDVINIEICCSRPEMVRWVESRNGDIPPNAIVGGINCYGEPLYIARAKQGSSKTEQVHPSHEEVYDVYMYSGKDISNQICEILCYV